MLTAAVLVRPASSTVSCAVSSKSIGAIISIARMLIVLIPETAILWVACKRLLTTVLMRKTALLLTGHTLSS